MGLGFAPLGVFGSVMLLTTPQLLAAHHLPEPQIAAVTAAGLIPGFCAFLLAPLMDWRFSRRTYAVTFTLVAAACAFAALLCMNDLAALTTLLGLFRQGDHLIVAEGCYGGTYRLLDQVFSRLGIAVTYVPVADPAGYRAALRPGTRAVLVESVSNPCLEVPDLEALVGIAHAAGALLVVDNTMLTPYWLRPLALGADLVVHSASKFLAGHNDTIGGIVTVRDPALAAQLGFLQNAIGAVLGPHDAWLVLRGIKTLALRLERQQHNALVVARWLRQQPRVVRVRYPGLADDPSHAALARSASGGGALLVFELDDVPAVQRLIERLSLIAYAESFGGVESLITVPAVQTHANLAPQERRRLGVTDTLLRLSVGVEHAADLIADLAAALT